MRKLLVIALILVCTSVSVVAKTLEEFDAELLVELAGISDASTVDIWKKANAAREAEDAAEAASLYAEVFRRAPRFVHALRRQAGAELSLGRRDLALQHGREALALERSAENLAAVASVLVNVPDGEPTSAEIEEAIPLIKEAVQLNPDDLYENSVLADVAIAAGDLDLLRRAVAKLEAAAPDAVGTHVMRMMVAGSDGEWSQARAALDRAAAAGLPAEAHRELLANLERSMPLHVRWGRPVALAFTAWFGVFALLLLAGAVLSHIALRAARKPPASLGQNATGLGAGVRRAYRAVLLLSCIFYYASIPVVILLLLGVGGGLLYGIFAIGRIPIKLVILIVVVVGVSVWAILKSLFIRARDEDPGTKLDLSLQPKLRALLDDVAKRIGTRSVDNVYLTPGTDVAVMERGRKKKKERCLILGVAALDGFALRPFKAVLGHEYGHFSNRDTAGGAFALAVRNSLAITAFGLAENGAAAWYNPAWLFVSGFNRVFLRISEGASRLQEILADRWAVFAYGADAFESGLRHVVERSVRFDAHVGATLKEVVDRQLPLANLYTYQPSEGDENLEQAIEESMNRKSSPYDSHPTPAERFALVRAIPQRSRRLEPDDDLPAWSLFSNPDELQLAMTAEVRENVRTNYGMEIQSAVQT